MLNGQLVKNLHGDSLALSPERVITQLYAAQLDDGCHGGMHRTSWHHRGGERLG